jgi:hypothetical protein
LTAPKAYICFGGDFFEKILYFSAFSFNYHESVLLRKICGTPKAQAGLSFVGCPEGDF